MRRTRILIADGNAVFSGAVRNVLAREKDFAVSEAASLRGVREWIEAGRGDLALVDLDLPPRGALAAVKALRERRSAEVIVWSYAADPETVFEAIRHGAIGYLHKEISAEGLIRSLRGAACGEAPLSRELMALMIGAIHSLEDRQKARERTALLSDREREVLAHLARGARNRQIAAALEISEFTVKRHVQNILGKLDLRSRHEAAAFYRSANPGIPAPERNGQLVSAGR